jgi:hypothetical protein
MSISIELLRDVFVKKLYLIKNSNSILTPVDEKQVDAVIKAAKLNPIDPIRLAALFSMPLPNTNVGMDPIIPLLGSPEDNMCFNFNNASLKWYFLYAYLGDMALNLIVFRMEMGTPKINKLMNINPADSCLYSISGGYGKRGGQWTYIPNTAIQGVYNCTNNNQFNLTGIMNPTNPWLTAFSLNYRDKVLNVNLQWNDNVIGAAGFTATLSSDVPPVYQGKDGCNPCLSGVGTDYLSFTNMSAVARFAQDSNEYRGPKAWLDHQNLQTGFVNNYILKLLTNVTQMFKAPLVIRWFWLTITLFEEDLQYMIYNILEELPVLGQEYVITVTKIKNNIPTYNLRGTATILEMTDVIDPDITVNITQHFPTKYQIELEGRTYILSAAFGIGLVYLFKGTKNWESVGLVTNELGDEIGCGFLEANQLLSEMDLIRIPAKIAGIHPKDYKLFLNKKAPLLSGLVSLAIILITLGIFFYLIFWIIRFIIRKYKYEF